MTLHQFRRPDAAKIPPPIEPGGSGPYDGGMEERVKKLEDTVSSLNESVIQVRQNVAVMRSNYATTASVEKAVHDQTWKFVGWMTSICVALVGITYFLATHLK